MLIIIEGSDGVGKTTVADLVARRIEAAFSREVVERHSGLPEPDEDLLRTYLDTIGDYAANDEDRAVVIDRLHWGEAVYGPLYRADDDQDGYGTLGKAGWRYIELYVASRGGVTFLIDAPDETAIRRAEERGEEFTDLDDIHGILAAYRLRYRDSTTGVRLTNEDGRDPNEIAAMIIDNATSRRYAAQALGAWPSYIGIIRPLTLVLMPPDQRRRLQLLEGLADNEWPHVGIASSDMPAEQLTELIETLGRPEVKILTTANAGQEYAHSGGAGAVVSLERRTRFSDIDELIESVRVYINSVP